MPRRRPAPGGQGARNATLEGLTASEASKTTTDRSVRGTARQRAKYASVFTEADGITFRSKREATRWQRLVIAEKGGVIRNLRRQVAYELRADGGALVGKYEADHVYEELQDGVWELVVEDVKGFPTPLYAWKKRHMAAEHGIEIREV